MRVTKPRTSSRERKQRVMRRTVLLLAVIGTAFVLASGVALADTIACQSGITCKGTKNADVITGTIDPDTIFALGATTRSPLAGPRTRSTPAPEWIPPMEGMAPTSTSSEAVGVRTP